MQTLLNKMIFTILVGLRSFQNQQIAQQSDIYDISTEEQVVCWGQYMKFEYGRKKTDD